MNANCIAMRMRTRMTKLVLLSGSIAIANTSCGPSAAPRQSSRPESDAATARGEPSNNAESFLTGIGFRGAIPDSIIRIVEEVQGMYQRDRVALDCLRELAKGGPVPVYALRAEDERHLIEMVCSSYAVKRIEGIKHRRGEGCELVMIDLATPSGNVSVFLLREQPTDWREFYKMAYEH